MKSILNFFIKDYKFKSDVELFRVKSFVVIIFSALFLLFAFMIRTLFLGYYTALYTQYLYLAAGIISLFFIKKGNFRLIGNLLSVLIVLTEMFALFSNMSNAKPFNFFVDEFYVFIVFIFFSTMFAERYVLIINTFLILFSSIFI